MTKARHPSCIVDRPAAATASACVYSLAIPSAACLTRSRKDCGSSTSIRGPKPNTYSQALCSSSNSIAICSHPSASGSGKGRERSPLSAREHEIVALVAQGYKNKEMAEKMFISEQTVKNHLHNIFDKLGVSDRLELALYAIHKGLHLNGEQPIR